LDNEIAIINSDRSLIENLPELCLGVVQRTTRTRFEFTRTICVILLVKRISKKLFLNDPLVNAVFFASLDHGMHIFGSCVIEDRAVGEDIAAILGHIVNQLLDIALEDCL